MSALRCPAVQCTRTVPARHTSGGAATLCSPAASPLIHVTGVPCPLQPKLNEEDLSTKQNTESRAFIQASFAVKSDEFVEIMLESYQKDSFSQSSVLMRAGTGKKISVPESS